MTLAGRRIHFVGVGGVGVSALAELACRRGAVVTGSDLKDSAALDRLRSAGVVIFPPGHRAEYASVADLVVYTSACPSDHVELVAARRTGVPTMRRAEFLAASVADRRTVAIAGAHGKTTTTAMTGAALVAAGLDPTILVGGYLREGGANLRVGAGPYAVVEADEYDRSFLALDPFVALVNNIDREHLDIYRDLDDLRATFAAFADRVPAGGVVLLGADDAEAASLRSRLRSPVRTFGLSESADVRAIDVKPDSIGSRFTLVVDGVRAGEIGLQVPGLHNVRNALGAAAAALACGADPESIARGLSSFRGVGRRFERLGERDGTLVVDDYAHHPSEMRATIAAARLVEPGRRLVVLFQPHLYSRTRDLAADFAVELAAADVALLAPIYGSREAPITGVTSALIAEAPGLRGRPTDRLQCPSDRPGVAAALAATLRPGDLLIVAGAGDVRGFAEAWLGRR